MKVPFFRIKISPAEKKAVAECLKSGWLTSGPNVERFERGIEGLTGAKYAAALSSGTAGLHLGLLTENIRAGDEVITTPYTMAATIEAVLYTGAKPVLVDIEKVGLNIDPDMIRKKINKKTKAVISIDVAGYPCRYDEIKKLSRKSKLLYISDAAHSLGAYYKGKAVGSLADLNVFSFYSTKNLTTGEGGMVVGNSKKKIEKIKRLALHGMTSTGWEKSKGKGWKYDITELGFKYNMPDLNASLGLGQLERFEINQEKRMKLAERYLKNLHDWQEYIELPWSDENYRHAWHLFIIKLNLNRWKISRDEVIARLEKAGVGCSVHFIPVYRLSYFKKKFKYKYADFPNSERAFKRVLSLPLYPDLKYSEVDYVCAQLTDIIKSHTK